MIDVLEMGGTEKQLIETMRMLDADRFIVYLVCFRNSEMLEKCEINGQKLVLDIRSFKSLGMVRKIFRLCSFLKREQIDIMQTFFPDANLLGVLAAKLAGVKNIVSSRRDLGFWYNKKELGRLKKINRFVNRFLVNSEAVKEILFQVEKVPKSKIDIIYNGIRLADFAEKDATYIRDLKAQLSIPRENIVIGCIANFNRKVKRVDIFIEAAAIIGKDLNRVSFLVIGDGYLKDELRALAKARNIENKIIFTGRRNDVAALLPVIDIGVLTSDSEGFSNILLEYMAASIPVVATAVGGNKELITHNRDGLLIPPQDSGAVAEAVLALVKNPALRRGFAEKAKQKVCKEYAMEKMIANLEKYYLNLYFEPFGIQIHQERPAEIA